MERNWDLGVLLLDRPVYEHFRITMLELYGENQKPDYYKECRRRVRLLLRALSIHATRLHGHKPSCHSFMSLVPTSVGTLVFTTRLGGTTYIKLDGHAKWNIPEIFAAERQGIALKNPHLHEGYIYPNVVLTENGYESH